MFGFAGHIPTFDLVCDASGFGVGAVLIQQGRPIAFWSRKMVPAEQNHHFTEQELLAVIEALKASGAMLMAYPLTWSLIINLTLSLALNLYCRGTKLAGVNTYSASTSHGNTDQAGLM
jgi:hypothetical protein